VQRNNQELWRGKAKGQSSMREEAAPTKSSVRCLTTRRQALQAWAKTAIARRDSTDPTDQALAAGIEGCIHKMQLAIEMARRIKAQQQRESPGLRVTKAPTTERTLSEPEIER
jgi:hypothetical protein